MEKHWTSRSIKDLTFAIAQDFSAQIEVIMENEGILRKDIARELGVSPGRVSQIFDNPDKLNLSSIVRCARAVKKKVSIVLYDDGDVDNDHGPVSAEVFSRVWERSGRPLDFFELEENMVLGRRITIPENNP